jgi:hypothetical protein
MAARLREVSEENFVQVYSAPSIFTRKFKTKWNLILQMLVNFFSYLTSPTVTRANWDGVLLNGVVVAVPFLAINAAKPRRAARQRIVVISFFLHDLGKHWIVRKMLVWLFSDRKVTLVTQTRSELADFAHLMELSQLAYIPYCLGDVVVDNDFAVEGEYIFAGGYTNRDYECLLEVAKRFDHRFLLAVSSLNKLPPCPSNVTVVRDIKLEEFNAYVKGALFVVVPLKKDVGSSGQMVALTAMSFGKAIIYTDIGCLAEYFVPGETGVPYVLNDQNSLYQAVKSLIESPALRKQIGENAREKRDREFRRERYTRDVVALFVGSEPSGEDNPFGRLA